MSRCNEVSGSGSSENLGVDRSLPSSHHGADTPRQLNHHGADTPLQISHHGADTPRHISHHGADTPRQISHHGADTPRHTSHHGTDTPLHIGQFSEGFSWGGRWGRGASSRFRGAPPLPPSLEIDTLYWLLKCRRFNDAKT